MDRDQDHLRLLSIFHYVFAGLMGFGTCIMAVYLGIFTLVFSAIDFTEIEQAAHRAAEEARQADVKAEAERQAVQKEAQARAAEQKLPPLKPGGLDAGEPGDQAPDRQPVEAPRPDQPPPAEQAANPDLALQPGGDAVPPGAQPPAGARQPEQPHAHEAADAHAPHMPEGVPKAMMGFMGAMFGAMILIYGICTVLLIMAGYKLSAYKSHTFCLVIAGLECLSIPLGTILGVFTLIVLLRPSVKVMFGVLDRSALPRDEYADDDDY